MAEAEALRQEQAAKERHERVELLRRQIGRRMLNASLANGWSAWVKLVDAKQYALKRLRDCANRLKSPVLAEAFTLWVDQARERKASARLRTYKVRVPRDLDRGPLWLLNPALPLALD